MSLTFLFPVYSKLSGRVTLEVNMRIKKKKLVCGAEWGYTKTIKNWHKVWGKLSKLQPANRSINQSTPDLKRASASDLRFPFFDCVFRPQARSNTTNWKKENRAQRSLLSGHMRKMKLQPEFSTNILHEFGTRRADPALSKGKCATMWPGWATSACMRLMLLFGFWLFSFAGLGRLLLQTQGGWWQNESHRQTVKPDSWDHVFRCCRSWNASRTILCTDEPQDLLT